MCNEFWTDPFPLFFIGVRIIFSVVHTISIEYSEEELCFIGE
jgi:hypothetical protein